MFLGQNKKTIFSKSLGICKMCLPTKYDDLNLCWKRPLQHERTSTPHNNGLKSFKTILIYLWLSFRFQYIFNILNQLIPEKRQVNVKYNDNDPSVQKGFLPIVLWLGVQCVSWNAPREFIVKYWVRYVEILAIVFIYVCAKMIANGMLNLHT